MTSSLTAELGVHQPLHIQVVFVDFLFACYIIVAGPASLSRHQPFLFGGNQHVPLRDSTSAAIDFSTLKSSALHCTTAVLLSTVLLVRVACCPCIPGAGFSLVCDCSRSSRCRLVAHRRTARVLEVVTRDAPSAIWGINYGSALGRLLIDRLVEHLGGVFELRLPLNDLFIVILNEIIGPVSVTIEVKTFSDDWLINSSCLHCTVIVDTSSVCI